MKKREVTKLLKGLRFELNRRHFYVLDLYANVLIELLRLNLTKKRFINSCAEKRALPSLQP